MDPWEAAFISIISLAGLGIAVILMITFKSNLLSLIPVDSIVCTVILLFCALIPVMLFSTGFFTDTINQSFDYSKASIVGFLGLLLTMLVGSTKFADFSRKIIGFFPPVFRKSDVPGVPNEWNWWVAGLFAILIALPVGLGYGLDRSTWSKELTTGISVMFVLLVLAGNGLLGKFSETASGITKGGSTFTVDPFPEGLCDVPGFTWAHNPIAPSSVILTQTIAWYYMIKNWDTGNGSKNAAIGISSGVIFLLQWFILNVKGCLENYNAGTFAPLIGYALSIGLGGVGYEIIKNIPSSGGSSTSLMSTSDGKLKSEAITVGGSQQEKSLPVDDDQDAFVCEAYKDGELITSTIVD